MTIALTLALVGLFSAAIPAGMFLHNRRRFLPPEDASPPAGQKPQAAKLKPISVLIPARDEAAGIAAAVTAALQSTGVRVEVVVLDDDSSDATAAIVRELATHDARVRLLAGKPLPAGWNGKQHACYQLAQAARYDRLVFVDADVRLRPEALRRMAAYQDAHEAALLSAFPHQITRTWLEKWLIPMMHFILLGFLPIERMRRSRDKAYAAGCGQLFMTRRSDYQRAGTHQAIAQSRHDGIKLPAAYRAAGLSSDILDGTPLASCRMYRGAAQVVRGLLKNATEGIAAPRLIVPFSTILLSAAVLPWVALGLAIGTGQGPALAVALLGLVAAHLPRALAARRFDQSWQGVLFHTPAVVLFVLLQWLALLLQLSGRPLRWRGRQ